MELRTYTFIDVLQPKLAAFLQTVSQGFLPLERQASLVIEIAPGIAINTVTDVALKKTRVVPGMQIVERAYGLLEIHSSDQGEVRAAGAAILAHLQLGESDRLAPRVLSREIITGVDDHQSAMIDRMRHGDMLVGGQTLYTLEVHPAGYAAIAANEAEKRADINLLEMVAFGAVGRLWLGGAEEDIRQASDAIDEVLAGIGGRTESQGGTQ
jgi:hypothetical protein